MKMNSIVNHVTVALQCSSTSSCIYV